jgi:hypothetical protein
MPTSISHIAPPGFQKVQIKLEEGYYSESFGTRGHYSKRPCTIGDGKMDVQFGEQVSKALYDYKDDTLRIIWRRDFGDRPTSFDAVGNPEVTLYVLRRAED